MTGPGRVVATLSHVTERTLVLVKPDGVARKLVGEVVSRIERKGLDLVALDLRTVDRELAAQHYAEHDGKPFFEELLSFITSGPVLAAVVEGPRAIAAWRQIAGGTDPVEKAPPAASAATSPWRPVPTSCTARTPRSRPTGRSSSGSRTCDRRRPGRPPGRRAPPRRRRRAR